MKRGNRRYIITFGLVALLGFFVCAPLEVTATLVWRETFDELDNEAWTTLLSCRLEDGALRGVDGDHISAVRAYRPSNISVGTWKFDLTECNEFDEELDICKIFSMSLGPPTVSDYYAFSIVHAGGEEDARYSYNLEKFTNSAPKVILDTHISEARPTYVGVLQHFAITRSNDALMAVYLNSSLIL